MTMELQVAYMSHFTSIDVGGNVNPFLSFILFQFIKLSKTNTYFWTTAHKLQSKYNLYTYLFFTSIACFLF